MWSLRAPSLRAHQGVVTSFILVLLALPGPHGLLPSRRLRRVIEFLKQFVLKAKATQLWLPLARSQSLSHSLSLPVLCSQGLVLVLIKAVSFCVLPAFFHSLLWAERKQPHGGKRNEEVTKSRVWKEQVLCYSAIQPVGGGNMRLASKGQMPGIGSLYGAVWCLLPLQSFRPYAQLAPSTAAPTLLGRLVWRGPGRQTSLLAAWV